MLTDRKGAVHGFAGGPWETSGDFPEFPDFLATKTWPGLLPSGLMMRANQRFGGHSTPGVCGAGGAWCCFRYKARGHGGRCSVPSTGARQLRSGEVEGFRLQIVGAPHRRGRGPDVGERLAAR